MKNLKCSFPAKVTAVILSYLMAIVCALSVVAVGFMGYSDYYIKSPEKLQRDILGEMAYKDCYLLAGYDKFERENLPDYYMDKNIFFTIEDANGKDIVSTYNGEKILLAEQYYTDNEIFTVYVADKMTNTDEYSFMRNLIVTGHKFRYTLIFFALGSFIALIALFCFLCSSAGHRKLYSGIKLNLLDKIPFDIYTAIVAFIGCCCAIFVIDTYSESLEVVLALFAIGTVLYFLALGLILTFAIRIKTSTLVKNTIIYKVLNLLWKGTRITARFLYYHLKRLPLVWKVLLATAAVLFIEFLALVGLRFNIESLLLVFLAINFVLVTAAIYIAITLERIKKGGQEIAKGNLDYKINTEYMVLDFKDFALSLNNINDTIKCEVDEKMKSERFKTELITNVSHDIKTPLTSLINYVDLLKKEELKNQTASEYIEVLDRHSVKLKKLIEDLVEASKASTGNLSVEFDKCDVGILLSQAVGEFHERLNLAGITPLLKIPKENVIIKADARHLWRVFDNLLSNICKYSQNGTRAYIDAFVDDGQAVITFRNISKYELNISKEELIERFVRGDSSRNTEGSGLGLSIAKSLVELQKGEFDIETDGDLFKVTIKFGIFEN